MIKRLALIAVLCLLSAAPSWADVFSFEAANDYSADNLYQLSKRLVETYPDYLELSVIGFSTDRLPIYALTLTDRSKTGIKKHLLVEAGLHAREQYNPFLVLKTLEAYCLALTEGDGTYEGFPLRTLLGKTVLHVIPLSNPDGYNVAKYGADKVGYADYVQTLTQPARFKGNLNGVDLNRNFPDAYYDAALGDWVDRWTTYAPTHLLKGPSPASEKETQVLMAYMNAYNFQAYLSYHSMGRVLYYYNTHLGEEHAALSTAYVRQIEAVTGYRPYKGDAGDYGYSTHYFKNETLKPAIVVETHGYSGFPTPHKYFKSEYDTYNLDRIPLTLLKAVAERPYDTYKLYKDGAYLRDYSSKVYAEAIAERDGGKVFAYDGDPIETLTPTHTTTLDFGETAVVVSEVLHAKEGLYLPVKNTFEALGYTVYYYAPDRELRMTRPGDTFKFPADALIDGKYLPLSQLEAHLPPLTAAVKGTADGYWLLPTP